MKSILELLTMVSKDVFPEALAPTRRKVGKVVEDEERYKYEWSSSGKVRTRSSVKVIAHGEGPSIAEK